MHYASLGRWDLLENGVTTNWSDEIYGIFDIDKSLNEAPNTLGVLVYPDDRSRVLQSLEGSFRQGGEFQTDF